MSLIRSTLLLKNNLSSKAISRSYAFKSDLKIKWIHPGKIECIEPAESGDLEALPKIDKSQYQVRFQNCKELEDANDLVKRLFTLEFAPRYKSTELYIKNTLRNVQRHPQDAGSIEAKIAQWTGWIRATQDLVKQSPRNKRVKIKLKELIDKRKKFLKNLRTYDYKRFEWLIENLNIVYKPSPMSKEPVTRKGSMIKLTEKYCDDLRNERLEEYKRQLEAQQPDFLREKIKMLEFIQKEQKECHVEVTVTQEEINNAKEQLEKLLKKQAAEQKDVDD